MYKSLESFSDQPLGLITDEKDGTTYTRPNPPMDLEYIELSMGLSSNHADDNRIVKLEANPELYPAQGAYIIEGKPQSTDFIVAMGNIVDSRFGDMLDGMLNNPEQVRTLHNIGELLTKGETVVNAVPHGPLLDIGLLHALAHAGLGRLGYDNRAGIVISQGITGLASEFNGSKVPLSTALSWTCDKIWLVTPRTENARKSKFSQVVPKELINFQNRVVRNDISNEQTVNFDSEGQPEHVGMLITAAISATSNSKKENGISKLANPTLGTLRMFARPHTRIAVNVGAIQGEQTPSIHIQPELLRLGGDDQSIISQGHTIMHRMVEGLNSTETSDTKFVYEEVISS